MSKLLKFKTNKYNYYQILDNKKPCLSITSNNSYLQEKNFVNNTNYIDYNLQNNNNISYTTYNYLIKKYNKNIIIQNNILKKISIERAIESGFINPKV